MDAATRAELAALRVRAYGPSADIADDPPALARLVALEESALPAPQRDASTAAVGGAPPPSGVERPDDGGASPDGRALDARVVATVPAPGRPRRRWHVALVGAVGTVAIALGVAAAGERPASPEPPTAALAASVRDARAFTDDPAARVVITIRIDGSFGDYVDIPSGADVPVFPVEGEMTWVEPLGDYFGWRLWIGGARGAIEDENCMLLDGDGTMRATCVPADLKSQGALLLHVPFAEIAPAERPDGMTSEESLGFWWGTDGTVKVVLAPTP